MKTDKALEWIEAHYGYAIEVYPVQADCVTYKYISLHEAKGILRQHSKLSNIDTPLIELENQKTFFSGINSMDFAKINLYTFVEIVKDYL